MSLQMKVARIQTQGSGRVMPGIGDPGFFGDVFGKVLDFGKKILGGTPIGAAATTIFQRPPPITIQGPSILPINVFQDRLGAPPSPNGISQTTPLQRLGQQLIPGGKTGFELNGNGNGVMLACPTGFHPNKTGYFTKGDCRTGTQAGFVEKGSKCVKNRRRNPLNARAADRAIGRIESAKRATKRLSRITIRKKC